MKYPGNEYEASIIRIIVVALFNSTCGIQDTGTQVRTRIVVFVIIVMQLHEMNTSYPAWIVNSDRQPQYPMTQRDPACLVPVRDLGTPTFQPGTRR